MKQLRIFTVVFALLMVCAVMPAPAHAAGLTEPQIQAIVNLLIAFNADQSVVTNVNAILHRTPVVTTPPPQTTTAPSCRVVATPNTVLYGEAVQLTWTSERATSAIWAGNTSGKDNIPPPTGTPAVNGTISFVPSLAPTVGWTQVPSVTLSVTGSGGTATCTAYFTVASPVQASFDPNFFRTATTTTPTLSGTATGVTQVGIVLSNSGGKIYGSGLIPVVNGRWAVTVSPALPLGNYMVYINDAQNHNLNNGGYLRVEQGGTVQTPVPTSAAPSFTASPSSGTAPFTTTYTLSNLPLQGGEMIDFGDGVRAPLGTAMPAVATHQYTVPGTYRATLLRGDSIFGYLSVTVTAAPVTAPICAPQPAVDCAQGFHPVSGGVNTNGCNLPDRCVATVVTCAPPVAVDCSIGFVPVSGGVTASGCALPNKCVASTAPRITATVSASAVATGQTLTVTWSAQNAPAGSYVYLQLVPVAGGTSGGVITDLKATSGSFIWTIPASNSVSYAGDYRIRGSNIISGASYKVRAFVYKPTTNTCIEGCSPTTGTPYTYGDSSNVTITTSAASGGGTAAPAQGASSFLGLMGDGLAAVMDGYLSLFGLSLQ